MEVDMYTLNELLNPGVYRDIIVVRLMREKVKFYESFCDALECAYQSDDYTLTQQVRDTFGDYAVTASDILVLEKIIYAFEMYRDNRYASGMELRFWRNDRILRKRLSSIYDNPDDIDDVVALVAKLYSENKNGSDA
jgi:hypothetical protein